MYQIINVKYGNLAYLWTNCSYIWTSDVLRFLKCSLEAYEFQGCNSLASLSEVLYNPTLSQYSKQRDFGQGSLKAKGLTVLELSGNTTISTWRVGRISKTELVSIKEHFRKRSTSLVHIN